MKKSLILVESPLQLLNAYEVIQYFKLEHYTLLVRFSNKPENDTQLSNVLARLPFVQSSVIKIYLSSNQKKTADYLKLIFIKILSVIYTYKYETVYSGNYDSKLFRLIASRFKLDNIFLLDDGNKSIRIQSEFSKESFCHLFTMFDLEPFEGQKVIRNIYSSIRALCNKYSYADNKVLFLGSGMSEIGITTEEYYLCLIKSISAFYQRLGFEVVYIPHRAEKEDKLKKIQSNDNIKLAKLNYPIELLGMYFEFKPVVVCSFCSTAILTLKIIYDMEVECFHFDYEGTPDKNELDNIYHYYEDYGIKVIRVEEYVA